MTFQVWSQSQEMVSLKREHWIGLTIRDKASNLAKGHPVFTITCPKSVFCGRLGVLVLGEMDRQGKRANMVMRLQMCDYFYALGQLPYTLTRIIHNSVTKIYTQ